MTFPAITRNVESKSKGESHVPNYSGAVKFLNTLKADKTRRRFSSSALKFRLIFMLILAIISICIIVASALR